MLYLLLTTFLYASDPIKVGVIDSGLDIKNTKVKLCNYGHKNFTNEKWTSGDEHGLNVSGIIDDNAKNTDYCQVIIKFYGKDNLDSGERFIKALEYANNINLDIINISVTGKTFIKEEKDAIENLLNKGVIVVVAAGNDASSLTKSKCDFYPACYDDRLIVVGALDKNNEKWKESNYGPIIDSWVIGESVKGGGYIFSGTSQATAKVTSTIIMLKKKLKDTQLDLKTTKKKR